MKTNKLIIISLIILTSCGVAKSDFDWLVGSWERKNGKPGTQTIESWKKVDGKTYKCISVVLKDKDTVYSEHCTIKKEGNDYYYIAEVPQNRNPTKFKIIKFNSEGFKAVNPEHDFPKEINYQISGNTIIASISGGDKKIDYNFEKQ
ncbi:DUF6265 family protein [Lacinutrix neustonica]|uniref:DUF6265 family protein n=1 Tax=Lacinutrix neustonica TaxID=2980107 RepID=A0A9E8MYB3_9FLAO|nr:DUF6265 family protein [Lacinutrix neustonica]WAC02757.1 DUF6265 family protein [Lacinutrix neustonica]